MHFAPSLLRFKIFITKIQIYLLLYICSKMLSSYGDASWKLSKTMSINFKTKERGAGRASYASRLGTHLISKYLSLMKTGSLLLRWGSRLLNTLVDAILQPDQINIAVYFWYLVISVLYTVRYCTRVHWTSHFLQGTRNTRPCITGRGHPVLC